MVECMTLSRYLQMNRKLRCLYFQFVVNVDLFKVVVGRFLFEVMRWEIARAYGFLSDFGLGFCWWNEVFMHVYLLSCNYFSFTFYILKIVHSCGQILVCKCVFWKFAIFLFEVLICVCGFGG